jgi:hypothetical protein
MGTSREQEAGDRRQETGSRKQEAGAGAGSRKPNEREVEIGKRPIERFVHFLSPVSGSPVSCLLVVSKDTP